MRRALLLLLLLWSLPLNAVPRWHLSRGLWPQSLEVELLDCVYRGHDRASHSAWHLDARRACCVDLLHGVHFYHKYYGRAMCVPSLNNYWYISRTQYEALFHSFVNQTGVEERHGCHIRPREQRINTINLKQLICSVSEDSRDAVAAEWSTSSEEAVKELNSSDTRKSLLRQLMKRYDLLLKQAVTNYHCYLLRVEEFRLQQLNISNSEAQRFFEEFKNYTNLYFDNDIKARIQMMDIIDRLSQPFILEKLVHNVTEENMDELLRSVEKVKAFEMAPLHSYLHFFLALKTDIQRSKLEANQITIRSMAQRRALWPNPRKKSLPFTTDIIHHRQECEKCCGNFSLKILDEFIKLRPIFDGILSLPHFILEGCLTDWRRTLFSIPSLDFKGSADGVRDLEDQSEATVMVHTACVQLMRVMSSSGRCPFEDVPKGTVEGARRCRRQLETDLKFRTSYIPVVSYLAYAQRIRIHICLLFLMVIHTNSICVNIPTTVEGVNEVPYCFLLKPGDPRCQKVIFSEPLCSLSRTVFRFKCERYFINSNYFTSKYELKGDNVKEDYQGFTDFNHLQLKAYQFRDDRINFDYKILTVKKLIPLEIILISLNILFRIFVIAVYFYLPPLRNVPGTALLTYQIVGLTQVLCSEVIYRFLGVPNITVIIQIDSSLTLLTCLWLNVFCHAIFQCIHKLQRPGQLHITQIRRAFRRYFVSTLALWLGICLTCFGFEWGGEHYLFHSRVFFLVAVSASIVFNFTLVLAVGYNFFIVRNDITKLDISCNSKVANKQQVLFLASKGFVLSGLGIVFRLGLHQAEGIAQWVYYIHLATMIQGPILFVLFVCNELVLPLLKKTLLSFWGLEHLISDRELCSSAERNLKRHREKIKQQPAVISKPLNLCVCGKT